MAAANKVGHPRGARRANPSPTHAPSVSTATSTGPAMTLVKQEDFSIKMHQRPGTSTGYEGDHNGLLYHQGATWHVQQSDLERPDSRPSNNHSFRDPGQSFLAPSTAPSHSFLPFTSTFSFGLPDPTRGEVRPGTSSSRPPTAGSIVDPSSRTLPPLSAVVSASLSASSQQQQLLPPPSSQQQQQSPQHILPLPTPFGLRRPSTATRPGTAPASASFFSSKPSLYGGPGLASRPELQLPFGRSTGSELGSAYSINNYDAEPASPITGQHDSPFFFQPASLINPQQSTALSSAVSPSTLNPRKRAFGGPDGPHDDAGDYGSESRPQSRRLSVLELCNDDGRPNTASSILLSRSGPPTSSGIRTSASRPDTSSSALISSASALAIVDPLSPTSTCGGDSPLLAGTPASPRSTTTASGGPGSYSGARRGGSPGPEELGRSHLSATSSTPSVRFDLSLSTSILHHRSGGGTSTFSRTSAFSSASSSPSLGSRSPNASPSFSTRNAISASSDATAASLPRRSHGTSDGKHDQVRITVSPHASAPVGMRA